MITFLIAIPCGLVNDTAVEEKFHLLTIPDRGFGLGLAVWLNRTIITITISRTRISTNIGWCLSDRILIRQVPLSYLFFEPAALHSTI